jgi:hypothetical protein
MAANYRAYFIGLDGRMVNSDGFVCADDEAAIEHAKRLMRGLSYDVELWTGARLVTTLRHGNINKTFTPR